ncbi:MAG TPA: UDP-glucose/GDP-mannose dehydrogenase family protein [Candidatus Saccharimonadales bacterium]|nr:UDP-glucose/GDP-mannose dehydrogenase family protein [Candidatus Saccharimonadales bacterium]
MNVTIVGTGYVGLVTGCCLADSGNRVICVDNNEQKVAALKGGEMPIYEPGLEEIMQRAVKEGRLTFTTDLAEGVNQSDAIFLALPTPPMEDGSADLSAVLAVAGALGDCLPDKYCVVIDKSTVPVGTAQAVRQAIATKGAGNFDVVSNPEFLREGFAVKDFTEPERVVVGVSSERAEQLMRTLYTPFVDDERPLYVTDPATAELTKYAANAFLVTKISFMNEMAHLCEAMGADVDMLRQAIGSDSRIGSKFLYPGIGAGGSCFPKDVRALKHMADEHKYNFKLLKAAMDVNDQQQRLLAERVVKHFNGKVKGRTFALWGLAFKPNTDDIREAPALTIINALVEAGATVTAYDPEAGQHVRERYAGNGQVQIVDDPYKALGQADALLVATAWPAFAGADLERIAAELQQPLVFDGRNVFKPDIMRDAGFTYYSIGRQPVLSR